MRESKIEKYLIQQVEKLGGVCWKWSSFGLAGVPDRIVLLPHGVHAFVEVKKAGGRLSPQQRAVLREILDRGHPAHVVYSVEDVDVFLDWCRHLLAGRGQQRS